MYQFSAYKSHKNVGIEEVVTIEPKTSSSFIFLSNIYVEMGKQTQKKKYLHVLELKFTKG